MQIAKIKGTNQTVSIIALDYKKGEALVQANNFGQPEASNRWKLPFSQIEIERWDES